MPLLHLVLLFFAVFALTVAFTYILVPILTRHRAAQPILEIGPAWHLSKSGTPTMGGLGFVLAIAFVFALDTAVLVFLGAGIRELSFLPILGYAVMCGAIGLVDDLAKLRKKRNEGLSAAQKYVLQLLAAGLFLFLCRAYFGLGTDIALPFSKKSIELGFFFYPLALLFLTGMDNALNLTDGLDGLLGTTAAVMGAFFVLCGNAWGSGVLSVCGVTVLGATLGFLIFNTHPARVFMGDTGSLFLGGLVGGVGILSAKPVTVFWAGGFFVAETASVMLQVIWFRFTKGKRLFLMAPLHHHLEKRGLCEGHIVAIGAAASALFCALAFLGG